MPTYKGTLWIYRGLPGSGKSTVAAKVAKAKQIQYFETDMWLYEFEDQDYYWSPERLIVAFNKCREAVEQEMKDAEDVVLTGVFTRFRNFEEYLELAQQYGYYTVVIEQRHQFGNIHDVPVDTLERMKKNFVPNEKMPPRPGVEYKVNAPAKGN